MGKKKHDVMAAQKDRFINGAVEKGVPEKKAAELFEQIEKFAGYGFNKSHSAAYAYLAYQTAWLKTHYRLPYLASLLTNELGNTDGVIKFINECRENGEMILPPDINASSLDFTIEGAGIRFGLVAVKNLGENAIQIILDEREKNGLFSSFDNFCVRLNLQKVNKRVIESLIKCGAFDSLRKKRSQLMKVLETALQLAQAKTKASSMGQMSLFDDYRQGEEGNRQDIHIQYPDIPEWPQTELLAREKEALGFYLTAHPLDAYMENLNKMTTVTACSANIPDNFLVGFGGMIKEKKVITTKKDEPMAFLTIEDKEGSIEVVCFPEVYARRGHLLNKEDVVWVIGTFKNSSEEKKPNKILAREIELLEIACKKRAKGVTIHINGEEVGPTVLAPLKKLFDRRKGEYPVTFSISIPGKGDVLLSLPDQYNLDIDREVARDVRKLLRYSAFSVDYDMMHPVMAEKKERWRQQ
jgi:DNA polymerase-3 subunit alpha